MARRILGLDIDTATVRAVLLDSAYRGFEVVGHGEMPLPAAVDGPERPLKDRQVEAIRSLVAARQWAFETAIVALPGASAASHLVTLPFTDTRRVEQTIGFEVEAQSPFDLADVAWDWQPLGVRAGRTDVLAAVVRKEEVAGLLAALGGAGIDPRAILPPGPAYAALFGHGLLAGEEQLPEGAIDVVLDVGTSRTSACVVSRHGAEWARTFPLGLTELRRAPAALTREVRATLKAFRARTGSEHHPVRRLLLAGEAAQVPAIADALRAEVEGTVEALALAGGAAEKIPPEEQPRFALALALALRGHQGSRAPRLNLRRNDLAYTRDFQHLRGKVARLAGWTALVVALALVSAGVKAFALSRHERLLDRALCDATQKIVGKCYDDFSVAESVLRGRGTPAAAVPKMSALDVFAELGTRSPADVPLRFDRIEITRDKLHLQGTTAAAEDVDRIVSALRGSRCFADARSGGARKRGDKFEFTVDSDLTCDTGAAAGGRVSQ